MWPGKKKVNASGFVSRRGARQAQEPIAFCCILCFWARRWCTTVFFCVCFTKAVAQRKKRKKESAFPTERRPRSVETLKKKRPEAD